MSIRKTRLMGGKCAPQATVFPKNSFALLVDLLSRTKQVEDCFFWTGAKRSTKGYGAVKILGKVRYVHRAIFELVKGPIPTGLVLDHLCRNDMCCNPDHLQPVTAQVNVHRGVSCVAQRANAAVCKAGHSLKLEPGKVALVKTRQGLVRICLQCKNA